MKTTNEIIEKLKEHSSTTPSMWREHAEWRIANRPWLRHSQLIAMKMLDRMEELNVSQKELAKMLGYSPQYVSNILKGKENLSISTLQKIEEALQLTILPNLAEA